jgi:hypothetical protein
VEIAQHGFSGGYRVQGRALQYNGGAGLRAARLCHDNQAGARPVGCLPKTEPRCQWNAACVLGCGIAQIEHDCGKSAGLQQQVCRSQRLI